MELPKLIHNYSLLTYHLNMCDLLQIKFGWPKMVHIVVTTWIVTIHWIVIHLVQRSVVYAIQNIIIPNVIAVKGRAA